MNRENLRTVLWENQLCFFHSWGFNSVEGRDGNMIWSVAIIELND